MRHLTTCKTVVDVIQWLKDYADESGQYGIALLGEKIDQQRKLLWQAEVWIHAYKKCGLLASDWLQWHEHARRVLGKEPKK